MQVNLDTDTGLLPAPALISREVDNIAVLYGTSRDDTWNAMAFKVNQVNRRIDYINNLPTLADATGLDFGFFGEDGHSEDTNQPGRDQLRIGDNVDNTIMELGVAIEPNDVLVGVQNPSGATITGVQDADRLRGFGPDSANANDFQEFGSVRSQHTRTSGGIPTTALSETPRQGLVRFDQSEDSRNNMRFGFYNDSGGSVSLSATIWGATYRVSVVRDSSAVRDVVFGRNGTQRRVLTYGGLQNTSPKRPSSWKDAEVEVTGDDARSALSSGQ